MLSVSRAIHPRLVCALLGTLMIGSVPASGADLASIIVLPDAGQSSQQLSRDRYECHNWVVAQNAAVPVQASGNQHTRAQRRGERIGQVITGAAIGAAAGGVIRGARDYREADDGALAGGVLGAIAGAVIGRKKEREDEDESFGAYFRGLDACMTARGYSLRIAGQEE